jgi:hypothetical protein
MELEGSLPCSQEPSISPYLSQTNPVNTTPSYLRSILILSSHLCLDLPSGLFPSRFATNILYAFLFSPFVLHAFPISCSLNLSFQFYLAMSTNCKLLIIQFLMYCYNLKIVLPLHRLCLQPERSSYKKASCGGPWPERHQSEAMRRLPPCLVPASSSKLPNTSSGVTWSTMTPSSLGSLKQACSSHNPASRTEFKYN